MLTLVLGGARSGKSRHAQTFAAGLGQRVCYIATAQAGDLEMAARIARHQAERPASWVTVEEPLDLAGAIAKSSEGAVLVDCLTLWLSNWLGQGEPSGYPVARGQLLDVLSTFQGDSCQHLVLVANEVGLGIVPLGELTRRFVDEAGWLNQEIAALADDVVWMVAGLPVILKNNV